ncbi:MAG: ABC transporter ATP-binding protein/permease [Oscillospiraceae bacterium]|nr:ABC transporter ATP-binding protein/permease [Oscillospiraceae bacterium]
MNAAEGTAVFSEDGRIVSECSGETAAELYAGDIEEAGVIAGVGCGLVFVRLKDGDERIICRFSMSKLKPAGEFCKIVNYCAQTGIADIPDEEDPIVCEKCGRPLIEGLGVCLFCYNKIGLLKKAFVYLRPYSKGLLTTQIMLVVSSALFLSVPIFNRYLIDDFLRPMRGGFSDMLFIGIGMLVARAVGEVIFILSSRRFNKFSIGFANDLRTVTYDKMQKLSMSSLSKRTPGDLIRRIMEDTATIKNFFTDVGRWAVEQSIMFIIVVVILLLTNPWMTLLVIAPVPIVMLALSQFWQLIIIRFERQWRWHSRCNSILYDIIKGIRTVKSFGNEDLEIEKFSNATRQLARVSSDNEALWARLFPAITFFTGIGEFLVLYFGGRMILGGEVSMGVLVQFTMYIVFIYAPLRWLVSFPRWLADAMTGMVKVFEILDEEPDITESENATTAPVSGRISFDGVSFGYKSYEPVLKGITLDISPGEMIGIVGKSGAGKSTLINLAIRLYDPNAGTVSIGGTDIRDMPPAHLHERIGVVFQDSFLFAGTIFDNIAYAKPGAAPEEVIAACKAANAHDFIMATADGYHTMIGESGHSLSGGERQRLSIARAIIKNPDILILDEATSSLDVETESAIQESLDRLTKGRTTIAIAHRLSTLRSANRLFVLDKGKVAESGTHVELLKKRGIYYSLIMAQRQTSSKS